MDERLDAIREWVDKYGKTEYGSVRELSYSMDHANCRHKIEFLLRRLDLAEQVIGAIREADDVSPEIAIALEYYERRVAR